VAIDQSEDPAARAARIDMILEELRLNTEDMLELAKNARERAARMRAHTQLAREARRADRKKR
jgi:hypothetical protein